MERGVGVPGGEEAGAVGVDEDEGGWEVGVVVDDVGEVGHGFAAFGQGGRVGVGAGGVGVAGDGVDSCLPAGLVVSKRKSWRMRIEVGRGIFTLADILLPSLYFPFRFWP